MANEIAAQPNIQQGEIILYQPDETVLMTYELTIPFKERTRFEEILHKIGFPVSTLKEIVGHAAIF